MLERLAKKLVRGLRSVSYDDVIPRHNGVEFEVNNWLISEFILSKLVPVVGTHPYPLCELSLMTAAVVRIRPSCIFEWGTHIGKSARCFYEICEYFKIEAEIYSVDLPENVDHIEHPHWRRGLLVKRKRKVKLLTGDGLETSLGLSGMIRNKDSSFRPLFFLDGDHSYESVKRELEGVVNELSFVNVLVHDTFYQSQDSGYNIGPYKAISEVVAKYPNVYKVLSTNTGLPGMTLLLNPVSL
jgi:cephalosporin hydroxylase